MPSTDGPPTALALRRRADAWVARRRPVLVLMLVLAGLVLRASTFGALRDSPVLWMHRWSQSDMHFFDAWARGIAEGDLLSAEVGHPHHHWHRAAAELHLAAHPGEAERLTTLAAARGDTRELTELVWDEWFGGRQWHQEPLYPYMLAGVYALLGADVRAVFVLQMVLGLGALVLAGRLARRAFGETAGVVTLALGLLCAPFLFYEQVLLRATPLVLAGLLLVAATGRLLERRRRADALAFGALSGLAFLLKTTFALYLVLALGLVLLRRGRRALPAVALALVAFAAVLSPAVVRNAVVGAPLFGFTSVGALNVVLHHAPGTIVTPAGFEPNLEDFAQVMGATGGATLGVIRETFSRHESVASALAPSAARLANVFHGYEAPNNVNLAHAAFHAPLLGRLPVGASLLMPLGLLGLGLALVRPRRSLALLALAVTALVPLVLFGTLARYRLLLLAALLPCAGFALVRLGAWVAARRWRPALLALAPVVLLGAVMARPLPADVHPVRVSDHAVPFGTYYQPLVVAALEARDLPEAAALMATSLEAEPPELAELSPDRPPRDAWEARLAEIYGPAHLQLAEFLEALGLGPEAEHHRRRGEALALAARLPPRL